MYIMREAIVIITIHYLTDCDIQYIHCSDNCYLLLLESPPLVPALQSGYYDLTWEECADLPSPMYAASAVLHKENIYVMAGNAPQNETLDYVFSYKININEWSRLPPPGHYFVMLQIIDDKLTAIGGLDNATKEYTNKLSTFDSNSNNWIQYFPNMINARSKPGVVTHEDHVIVVGGRKGGSDDIEILNWTQATRWIKSSVKLPEPMWRPSLTISHDQLYIVGYSHDGRHSKAYQVPVDFIISQPPTSHLSGNWNKLPNAPHFNTVLLPHSYPPVIIGGNIQYIPTSNVSILDVTKKTWIRVASLSTARYCVAVVPISHGSILIIGGTKGGDDVQAIKASSVTTVEKGMVTLSHTVATMPTQDSTYTI